MPLYDTLPVYNRVITSKKRGFVMENTINALIFVAGRITAVYFANYSRTEASGKREQKCNDIFTFFVCLALQPWLWAFF